MSPVTLTADLGELLGDGDFEARARLAGITVTVREVVYVQAAPDGQTAVLSSW